MNAKSPLSPYNSNGNYGTKHTWIFLEAKHVYTANNPHSLPAILTIATPLSWEWDSVYPSPTIFWDYANAV